MKKIIKALFLISVLVLVYYYRVNIVDYIVTNYIYNKEIEAPEPNEYKRDYDFSFIKRTDDFSPDNKQDLYNIFYTILNNGYSEFTFYCGDEYESCQEDVKELTQSDNQTLGTINNYVHPFNSYKSIHIGMNNFGKIVVKVEKLYSEEDIVNINNKVDALYNLLITPSMSVETKIKTVHDYIIKNTSYDTNYIKGTLDRNIKSNTAYGPLFSGKALCGGYTDLMELFLEKMSIKSYKIASERHIWNYVYTGNSWKHLDLTWDDPITSTGRSLLEYDYYMISTAKLVSLKDDEHTYNKNFYLEAN